MKRPPDLLKGNGVAGKIDMDGGTPIGQSFYAEAGPFPEHTKVVVLSVQEADLIAGRILQLEAFRDTVHRATLKLYPPEEL